MKILIADDQAFIRQALAEVLKLLEQEVQVVQAGSADEAIRHAKSSQDFDLILLDWVFPGGSGGTNMLLEIRKKLPAVPVIVFSGYDDRDRIVSALDAGAMGFISKCESHEEVLRAVKCVLSGEICLPQSIRHIPLPALSAAETTSRVEHTPNRDLDTLDNFTPQQLRVLCLLIQGLPNKLIAREIEKQTGRELKDATVKAHISRIFDVLAVKNRTQAVIEIFKRGIQLEDIQKRIPKESSVRSDRNSPLVHSADYRSK